MLVDILEGLGRRREGANNALTMGREEFILELPWTVEVEWMWGDGDGDGDDRNRVSTFEGGSMVC
jgi:hypothetical protein